MIDIIWEGKPISVTAHASEVEEAMLGLHDFLRHYQLTVQVDPGLQGRFRLDPR